MERVMSLEATTSAMESTKKDQEPSFRSIRRQDQRLRGKGERGGVWG